MRFGPLIDQLIEAFQCLPGVGPKSAQRMTLHLLERDRAGGEFLAQSLERALARVGRCTRCRNLSESELCPICASERRDRSVLCVVETPADVLAVEQAGGYVGLYFVLLGRLSPIDGVTPETIGLPLLEQRLGSGEVREMIVATGTTMEGEATAHYLGEMLRARGLVVSRIARGLPVGGELEHTDIGTIAQALSERRPA